MNRIKRFLVLALLLAVLLPAIAADGRARYVFLMIGDGMGDAVRELFYDQCGPGALGSFPVNIPTGTNNVEGGTTDSAASGTALACGIKTRNGRLGIDADGRPVTSLAKILRDGGYRIGIASSVGINDATPGAHYANRITRRDRGGVLSDLLASDFDFFGIGMVLQPSGSRATDFTGLLKRFGWQVSRDDELGSLEPGKRHAFFTNLNPVWGEAKRTTPSLADLTREAARLLKNERGFFLMVEGGAIDHAAHRNDSAGVVREMIEFDGAVRAALEFRAAHPDDTLVVVTADHDTGGIVFAPGARPAPGYYRTQTMSMLQLQKELETRVKKGKQTDAAGLIAWSCRQAGLENPSAEEQAKLEKAAGLFLDGKSTGRDKMTGYGRYNPLAVEALRLRDARQGISFTTFGHTNRKVTTGAWGVGQALFTEPLENSDIPHRLAVAMLGSDEALKQGARTIPLPPSTVGDFFSFRSAAADSLSFSFGQMKVVELTFTLTGDGRSRTQTGQDSFGYLTFDGLRPDTEYTLTVAGPGRKPLRLTARTLPEVKEPKLLSCVVISDTHVSPRPDQRPRLHSSSAATLKNIFDTLRQNGSPPVLWPGDVTDKSLMVELQEVQKTIKDYRGRIIAVPGNHDSLKDASFAKLWGELFGATAGCATVDGVQLLWLDTGDGKLDKPGNRAAVAALDPARPAIVISHYQLVRDAHIRDKDAGIHDAAEPAVAAMLETIGKSRSVIYVGHKNTATEARLGKTPQFNLPQTTQFPAGYLVLDIYPSGVVQRFVPCLTPYEEERSRRLSGKSWEPRHRHGFTVWNRYQAFPEK